MNRSENTKELLCLWQEVILEVRGSVMDSAGKSIDMNRVEQSGKLLWALTKVPEKKVRNLALALSEAISTKDQIKRDVAEQALFFL